MIQSESIVMELEVCADREESISRRKWIFLRAKRCFDVAVSAMALIVLSPMFLLLAVLVFLDDPGPVFFGHRRVGQDGKMIRVWKFRSMCVNAEEKLLELSPQQREEYYRNYKLDADPRITRVGSFLRKSSLDELPQLFNVLKGDMSIVGPRPVVERELENYGRNKSKFLSVRPGITGYWQVKGRNCINYEDGRCDLELYYVDHMSVWLDLKVMIGTVWVVLTQRGAG